MERGPRAGTNVKGNRKMASAGRGSPRWEGEPLDQVDELAAPRLQKPRRRLEFPGTRSGEGSSWIQDPSQSSATI